MSVMNAKTCCDALLDEHGALDDKAQSLSDYLRWHSILGSRMGAGARLGRSVALQELFKEAAGATAHGQQRLKVVLEEIHAHCTGQRAAAQRRAGTVRMQLQSLPLGTPILVKDPHFRTPVAFVAVRRTRFVFEDADGRRFEAPIHAIDRIVEGEPLSLVPEAQREKRELVRGLAGGSFPEAREQLLADGLASLDALVGELEAAFRRVENAPVGMSKGLLTSSLGPGRLVSPLDQALIRRIPGVISELAKEAGPAEVRQRLRASKNDKVIGTVEAALQVIEEHTGLAQRE